MSSEEIVSNGISTSADENDLSSQGKGDPAARMNRRLLLALHPRRFELIPRLPAHELG